MIEIKGYIERKEGSSEKGIEWALWLYGFMALWLYVDASKIFLLY